ncbi:hypothetical protein E2P81_ATG03463 [Venturia nashicola]|nr:hypothetical protein E2P81_ATG03463 [Venturia nashicola]
MASKLNRFLISGVVAIVIITSSFVGFQLDFNSRWRTDRWPKGIPMEHPTHFSYDDMTYTSPASPVTLEDIVQTLWKPLVTPITDESFVDHNGATQNLGEKGEQHWMRPLGKKLCIVDIDTRPLSGDHQIFNPGNVAWKDLDMLGSGMLNHYLYAMIHGYTYHFIKTTPLKDRTAYWTKIPALASTLSNDRCDITVSIDADASFMNLNLPFEWLLNRWNFTSTTSMALALDPIAKVNKDAKHGRTNLNAGFVVAQNNERTHQILKAWSACPDDQVTYPDCARWKKKWPAEQAALSEYIRYKFTKEEDIKPIACNDANGYPESNTECQGTFIQHHWVKKKLVRPAVIESVMSGLVDRLRTSFVETGIVADAEWEKTSAKTSLRTSKEVRDV